jgi:tetratricopeptide (TPR) repeat protein
MRQCAVFRGGFSLAAAETVLRLDEASSPPPTVDALHALVSSSLLICEYPGGASAPARYGMFESIRDYAYESLTQLGARGAVEKRHAEFYLQRGEELAARYGEADEVDATRELSLELGNLLEVHRCALAERPATSSRAALAVLPVAIAHGSYLMYAELFDDAVDAAVRAGAPDLEARARWARSARLRTGIGSDAAERDLERVLVIARERGDRELEANANVGLGAILFFLPSRLDDVQRCWQQALLTYEAIGDDNGAANALANLALLELERGHHERAQQLARRALQRITAAGALHRRSFPLIVLAGVAQDRGDLGQARVHYEEALRIAGELHAHQGHEAEALMHLGIVECEAADWSAARQRLLEAIDRYAKLAMPSEAGFAFAFLAAVEAAQKDHGAASRALDSARGLLRSLRARGATEVATAIEGVLSAFRTKTPGDAAATGAERILGESEAKALPHLARAARRVLRHAAAAATGAELAAPLPLLRVERTGRWFQSADGKRVSLGRRMLLRRLLSALAEYQIAAPGRPQLPAELVAACWPGENIPAESANNRLYVAISKLRKHGLQAVLRTVDDGYQLAARIELIDD